MARGLIRGRKLPAWDSTKGVFLYLREHGDVKHTVDDLLRADNDDPENWDAKATMIWACCRLVEKGKIKTEFHPPRTVYYWYELPKDEAEARSKLAQYHDAMNAYDAPPALGR